MQELAKQCEEFTGIASINSQKIDRLKSLYQSATDTYGRSGFIYFDGYSSGMEDALRILHEPLPVLDAVKKSRLISKKKLVVVGLVGYILYKRHKNGVLLPEKKDDNQ